MEVFPVVAMCRRKGEAAIKEIIHQSSSHETEVSILASSIDIKDPPVLEVNCVSADSPLSFTSQIKIGFIKLIKLNFLAVASSLFHLVHCVKIGEQFHLYRFGDQQCFVWWQFLIFTTVIPAIVIFPFLFGRLLDLLKTRSISSDMFTVSCVVPFLIFGPYFKKGSGKSSKSQCTKQNEGEQEEEKRCTKEILDMEETLFNSDGNKMRWPIVQLYRNLLVVVIDTFVLSPVFKSMWFSVLFIAFLIHDRYRMPYRNSYLNHLQRFTSVALFLVNLCSIPSSFSSVGDVTALPGMPIALIILGYFEKVLYAMVPLTLPIWKLWVHFENKKKGSKRT